MSGGTPPDISGKADTVLTTNGDTLYYNNGRQRLAKGSDDQVLTLSSGLPSWSTASAGDLVFIEKVQNGSSSNTISKLSGLDDYDIIVCYFYLTESGTGTFIPSLKPYYNGSIRAMEGINEVIDGISSKTNGASYMPLDANYTSANICAGYLIMQNGTGSTTYQNLTVHYTTGLNYTSNAPYVATTYAKMVSGSYMVDGLEFKNVGTSTNFGSASKLYFYGVNTS